MSLVWNGDWVGETLDSHGGVSQYGDVEYKGTFSGTPALNTRLILGTSVDGFTGRAGGQLAKFLVKVGDQYGSSSGERTLIRQTEPIIARASGYQSYLALSVMFPNEWGFGLGSSGFDCWQFVEWHGQGGVNAPVGLRPLYDHVQIEINGGSNTSPTRQPRVPVITSLQSKLGQWHDLILYVNHHASNGAVTLWHRLPASQASFTQVYTATGIPTLFTGDSNYLLFGCYGAAVGVDRWLYHGGAREYTTFAEAETWLLSLGGAGGGGGGGGGGGATGPFDGAWSSSLQINAAGGAPSPPAPASRINRSWPHESPSSRPARRRP